MIYVNCKSDLHLFFSLLSVAFFSSPRVFHQRKQPSAMARDDPDPKNIIPNDQKQMRNASDRAQGLDSYFKTVEAQVEATKSRQG
jgi:hypothetical protein